MFDIVKNGVDQRGYSYHGASELFPNEWFRVVGRTVLRGESGKEYKLLKAGRYHVK